MPSTNNFTQPDLPIFKKMHTLSYNYVLCSYWNLYGQTNMAKII